MPNLGSLAETVSASNSNGHCGKQKAEIKSASALAQVVVRPAHPSTPRSRPNEPSRECLLKSSLEMAA
jgi:hypothetical protein